MKSPLRKGQTIRVRLIDGSIVTRTVWGAEEDVVFLCSEAQYKRLENGEDAPPAIGFPIEDVQETA